MTSPAGLRSAVSTFPARCSPLLPPSLLLLGLTWGSSATFAWSSPQVIGILVAATLLFGAFILVERVVVEPILPLDLFRNRVFAVASLLSLLPLMVMVGLIVYLPLFLQGVLGVSATSAGAVITPMTVSSVFGAMLAGFRDYPAQTLSADHHIERPRHDRRCVPVEPHNTLDESAGSHHLYGDRGHRPGSVLLCADDRCAECTTAHAPGHRHQRGEVPQPAWRCAGCSNCRNRGEHIPLPAISPSVSRLPSHTSSHPQG